MWEWNCRGSIYDISRDRLTAALTTKKESKEVVQKTGHVSPGNACTAK